jgi:hypothetical protein
MKLDKQILIRIEEEKIKIISRWVFVVKNALAWLAVGLILGSGSLALSLAVLITRENGLLFSKILLSFFWIIVFVGLGFSVYQRLMQIGFKYFHRLRYLTLAAFVLVINIALGGVFFENGQTEKIQIMLEKIPAYEKIMPDASNMAEDENIKIEKPSLDSSHEEDIMQKDNQPQIEKETQEDAAEEAVNKKIMMEVQAQPVGSDFKSRLNQQANPENQGLEKAAAELSPEIETRKSNGQAEDELDAVVETSGRKEAEVKKKEIEDEEEYVEADEADETEAEAETEDETEAEAETEDEADEED